MTTWTTEDNDFIHQLTIGFLRIGRKYKRFMNRSLAENGAVGVAYSYIVAIARNPGVHQDHLADIQGVDKSGVARVLRDLEVDGYIARELFPDDRRRNMISLTEKGQELHGLIRRITREWETLIKGSIQEQDIITTIQTIDQIVENIDK